MDNLQNSIIVLVGASGTGKTLLANLFAKKYSFTKVVTHTTRPKRNSEVDGIDYYFCTKEEFERMVNSKKTLEYVTNYDNYYGTFQSDCQARSIIVLDIRGAKTWKEYAKSIGLSVIVVLVNLSPETRLNRMLKRGDTIDASKKRIQMDNDIDLINNEEIDLILNIEEDETPEQLTVKLYELLH